MRWVLIGDGDSPHLAKWARALAPRVELHVLSSRRFAPAIEALVPPERRLALDTTPAFEGGNVGLLAKLPQAARWLRGVQPQVLHAHYLTSHGTLAWLAQRLYRVPGRLVGSAWGSDILVTPRRSSAARWLTRRVLRACVLATSDSKHMAARMCELGAGALMVFPFGLESLPEPPGAKDAHLFFANRGLEPIYAPQRVLALFASIAGHWPDARLVIANDGSLRAALERDVQARGLRDRVRFTGRLNADEQAAWYAHARWYFSVPQSDSVSVSVLEAMAHGCVPLLSDLPANRELVEHGTNGLIVGGDTLDLAALERLQSDADRIARANHAWVREHALFEPCVERFLARLRTLCPELQGAT